MQTKTGAIKAKQTIQEKYGLTSDGKSALHVRVGALGGKSGKAQGTIKGFALNPEHTRLAGAKGGRISRKGHKYLYTKEGLNYYIENSSQSVVTFKDEL